MTCQRLSLTLWIALGCALGANLPGRLPVGASAGSLGLAQPAPATATLSLPPVLRDTLPNALQVMVVRRPELPIVTFALRVKAGAAHDPSGQEGLAALTASLLREGAGPRSGPDISEAIDFAGGRLGVDTGTISTTLEIAALKKDAALALALLADMAQHPTFPAQAFEIVRGQLLASVRQQRDDPAHLAHLHLSNLLFGDAHPLGRTASDTSLAGLTRDAVRSFHERHYRPNNAILLAIGDVDPVAMRDQLRARFGGWPVGELSEPPRPTVPRLGAYRVRFVEKPGQTQVQIALASPGLANTDPRFEAAAVGNYVLGGGLFSSRLMASIRSEGGRTYGIGSQLSGYTFPGALWVTTFTRNEGSLETLPLILAELHRMRGAGVTTDELQKAKQHLVGNYPIQLETLDGVAGALLSAALYGRDPEWVTAYPERLQQIGKGEVDAVMRELIPPGALAVVLLGDPGVLAGRAELFDGVPLASVERVSWLDPIRSPGGARSAAE